MAHAKSEGMLRDMRKTLSLLAFCLLLVLTASVGSAFATATSSVEAVIDDNKQVTISGFISAGPGQIANILVVDPAGNACYLNSVVTSGLGNYQASYTMPSIAPGTYQVTVNTLTETIPLVTFFTYGVDNDLKSLSISRGGLDKAFAPNTTEYAVSVDSRVNSISVTPTVSDSTATVKVNGTAVISGQASAEIPLEEGINSITVAVISLKGESKTYTLVVTKAGTAETSMGVTAGINSSKKVTVSGTIDAGAGQLVTVSITDPKGDTEYIGTVISSADGAFELTYTLSNTLNGRYTVLVGALGVATPVSTYFDNTELANLVVSDITLIPAFDKDTRLYTAKASDEVKSVTVTPSCGDSAVTITVNGETVTSGSSSSAIALEATTNAINVVVTGQDGESSKTYVVTIDKDIVEKVDGTVAAAISKHKLVAIDGAVGTKEDYQVSVQVTDPEDDLDFLDATETAANGAYGFVYITEKKIAGAYPVSIGAIGLKYPVGTYFMIDPGNPNLENLALNSAATWSPDFSAERTEYELYVPAATESVTLTPTAIDPMAIIKVNSTEVESGSASESISLSMGQNIVQVLVTTMDGQEKNYVLNITRNASDATLQDLRLTEGSLSPSFAASTTNYTVTVGSLTKMLSVTPTVNESTATIAVNGSTAKSGADYGPLILEVGANTIEIEVTSGDKATSKTYIVTINREKSKDASLRNLNMSSGHLNPLFSSDTTGYAMTVGNSVTSLTVTPTVNEDTATVKVNGSAVASGCASGAINLTVGANSISVEVTAGDKTTKQTYTIIVTREKSKDATLSNLTLSSSSLEPSFLPNKTAYTATVANKVTSLSLTPTVNEATATVKVNSNMVNRGQAAGVINLQVGANKVEVEVTAGDGSTKKIYTVIVNREPSSDATLRGLIISGGGNLKPSFSTDKTNYDVTVKNELHQVTVTPTVNENTARVWVNGALVPSGQTSLPIILSVGANTIKVEVIAGDKTTKKTYTLNVTRDLPANVNLRDLTVSSGSLSPLFALGRTNYNVSVSNHVTSFSVSATAYDSKATVRVNNGPATAGFSSRTISLDEGNNTITIEVTAQNGAKQDYTIVVTRASSSNAYLSNLNISSGSLSPAFSPTNPGYAVSVGNDITSVTVTPTVSDSNATVRVNNVPVASGSPSTPIALNTGANTISIVVTAPSGNNRSYTVVVTRGKSGDATLISLTTNPDILGGVFDPNNAYYPVTVGNEIDVLTVTAIAKHPAATVSLRDGNDTELANPISLNVGLNVIRVVAAAEDGSEKRYVLAVTRAQAQYIVSFDKNGGDTTANPTSKTVYSGNSVGSLPTAPIRKHYNFDGWYTGSDGSGAEFTATTPVTGNITVYAKWSIKPMYRVDFDANGGDGQYSEYEMVYSGEKVESMPTAPTREHYTFGGWYTASDGSGSELTSNTPVTSNITVYAKWTPANYLMSFHPNQGTWDTPTSKWFSYGAKVGDWRPAVQPSRLPHYSFSGWNTLPDGGGLDLTNDTIITGNMIFYAKWAPANYTVTFNENGGDTPAEPGSIEVPYGTRVGTLPTIAPVRAHYTFSGWNTNSDGNGTAFTADTEVYGDITVYAKWTQANYTVTFDQNGGTTQGYPVYRTVPYGGTVAVPFWPTAPMRNHYTFAGWYTERDGGGSEFKVDETKVYGDTTVYAKWTPVNYTVTFNATGGVELDAQTVPYGQAGLLPTTTRNHYNFGGWYPNEAGTGTKVENYLQVAGDITVYAKWTPVAYTVAFELNYDGAGENPASKIVTYYNQVGTLPQPARTHYNFDGWYPNEEGTGTKYVETTLVLGKTTLYAKWIPKTYTIAFDLNYAGARDNPESQAIIYPANLGALPEPTRANYIFGGWYSNADGSGNVYVEGNSLTSNITVYAKWIPLSSDATLSNLTTSDGFLGHYSSGTLQYLAAVANEIDELTVTPTTTHDKATIKINGQSAESGIPFGPIPLIVGVQATTIEVVVTAEDGVTTETYIVKVTRNKSSNANLNSLVISDGALSPAFSAGTVNYAASVANTVNSLTITPTVDDDHAIVTVEGDVVESGTASEPTSLSVGENVIEVVVEAEDGSTKTYTITVTREDVAPTYTVTIGHLGNMGTITANPSSAMAGTIISLTVVPMLENLRLKEGTLVYRFIDDGEDPYPINEDTLTFEMPAGNIEIAAEFEQISVATLSAVLLSDGELIPEFVAIVTEYTVNVANTISTLTVTPIPTEPFAEVELTVGSTSVTGSVSLEVGQTVFKVQVTSEDGSETMVYTITVIRAEE